MTDIPEDAIARLQKRVDDWKHNSDTATVSVKLGDLRAAVAYLADRAAQAERMARLEEALRKANRRLLIEHGCHDPQDLRCETCRTMSEVDAILRAKNRKREDDVGAHPDREAGQAS